MNLSKVLIFGWYFFGLILSNKIVEIEMEYIFKGFWGFVVKLRNWWIFLIVFWIFLDLLGFLFVLYRVKVIKVCLLNFVWCGCFCLRYWMVGWIIDCMNLLFGWCVFKFFVKIVINRLNKVVMIFILWIILLLLFVWLMLFIFLWIVWLFGIFNFFVNEC